MVCTDSSVFPTSTGYGPTLTIVALAIRACRELAGLPPLPAPVADGAMRPLDRLARMDLAALSDLSLPDQNGTEHRLGDLWGDKPVVLVFLRHFGCLHCRDHAVQLRDRYDDLQRQGIDLVAIGTGDQRYAGAFVRDEKIPFLVLVDDDAKAAHAASVKVASWYRLLHPTHVDGDGRRRGSAAHRVHKAGKRVTQLGATFVLGPGDQVRYSTSTPTAPTTRRSPTILAAVGV